MNQAMYFEKFKESNLLKEEVEEFWQRSKILDSQNRILKHLA